MRWTFHILPILLQALASPEAIPETVYYVNSRRVILSFEPANATRIDRVQLWVSTDDGKTWEHSDATHAAQNALRFDAPQDGKYSFYMVLANRGGPSAEPPSSDSEPHAAVIVDTAPPTMQIHKARQLTTADGHRQIRLNISLIEENLGEAGTRLFYKANAEAGWQDGGPVVFADGIINWLPPPGIGPRIDIRVVATDLAGNRACDEIRNLAIKPAPPDARPDAANTEQSTNETGGPAGEGQLDVPPVRPVTVPPVPLVTLPGQPEPPPTSQRSPPVERQSKRLRELAARYLAEGRASLAGARLREALELAPDDPDLLADLGSVLYRARRYEEADRRFQDALQGAPEHLGAIEGLALVAFTQNRYAQARSHLLHLLRLSPESARHWLRYGDTEHMLGDSVEARAAWEKALEFEPADQTIREKVEKRLKLFDQKRTDSE